MVGGDDEVMMVRLVFGKNCCMCVCMLLSELPFSICLHTATGRQCLSSFFFSVPRVWKSVSYYHHYHLPSIPPCYNTKFEN